MPGLLHSAPYQKPEIPQSCPHLWICRRNGIRLLTPLSSISFLKISCIFCFCVQGHKFSFVGVLMDFLRLYLVSVLTPGYFCVFSVGSWSIDISKSGRLSGSFMNLVALPIELGFSVQSSDGCLDLRSPTLWHFVLLLIWFSTITDQGDFSLIPL